MVRCRQRQRRRSVPEAKTPLDDEDLLREILLRLPPQPSSLPRASAVCTRWHRVVLDAGFLRRFRGRHRKPSLLGFFLQGLRKYPPSFVPALDPPNRIPAERFSGPQGFEEGLEFLGCRHGLALFLDWSRRVVLLWDPITGHERRVSFPLLPGYTDNMVRNAAIVCADDRVGHVHGACLHSPFKLAVVGNISTRAFACVYNSESNEWGNVIFVEASLINSSRPGIVVGDAFFWLLWEGGILKFDLEMQSLVVIDKPANAHFTYCHSFPSNFQILRIEGGSVGLAIVSEHNIQLWKRKPNHEAVVAWALWKTIKLGELLPLRLCVGGIPAQILSYDEDTNVILLSMGACHLMIQLDSMEIKRISKIDRKRHGSFVYYPYTNFFIAGRGIGGQDGGADMINDI